MPTLEQLQADLLLRAAREGHAAIVAQLLAESPEIVDEVDDDGQTALHYAAERGHIEVIEQLLAHKPALVDIADSIGSIPLLHAAAAGHGEAVALLLAHKPETIDWQSLEGENALHWAAYGGQEHIVEQLLALKPSLIDETTSCTRTALHLAAVSGHDGVVARLLALRPSLFDMEDDGGHTALHRAAIAGHDKIVERLLAFGPNLHKPYKSSDTPLHSVAERLRPGREKVVAQLLAYDPTLIDARDFSGRNALHVAADAGNEEVVALLLAHSPELIDSKSSRTGATALHLAALANRVRVLSQLIAIRPSLVHEVDSEGKTALFYGALHDETVELLLPLTPKQVFMRDHEGNTLLHCSLAKPGYVRKPRSKELIEKVWRMNPKALRKTNAEGLTPLHLAAIYHEWAFEFFQWKFRMDDIVQALAARPRSQAEAPLQRVRPLVVGECNGPLLECLHQDLVDEIYEYLGLERRARKRKLEEEE